MHPIYDSRHDRHGADFYHILHVPNRLLIVQIQHELLLNLPQCFIRLEGYVRHRRVDHQREQVEYEVGVAPEAQVSRVALLAEFLVVFRGGAAESVDHLLGELHRRRHDLGVPAQDIPKIYVEQPARLGDHQVVQVSVADAQDEGDDAVAGAALDVRVHHFRLDLTFVGGSGSGSGFVRIVFAEKVLDRALVGQDVGDGEGVVDELHEAVFGRRGQHPVRGQLEVEILLLKNPVHQGYYLQDELILSQVIAVFEQGDVIAAGRGRLKGQSGRH